MTVHVQLFAILADQIGRRQTTLQLPNGTTVAAALEQLSIEFPPVAALRDQLAVAVNAEYVKRNTVLSDGDELALIPPVSGG